MKELLANAELMDILKPCAQLIGILILALWSMVLVREKRCVVIERLGKFHRVMMPGLHARVPIIEQKVRDLGLAVIQEVLPVDTKTKDDVSVNVGFSVNIRVNPEKVYEFSYASGDPGDQLRDCITNEARSQITGLSLDEVFMSQSALSLACLDVAAVVMESYGVIIEHLWITDITPAANVVAAMNDVNEAQRRRKAATDEAEADKIKVVAAAQAQAESKKLQGEGMANQRKAIMAGLKESAVEMNALEGVDPSDALHMMLITQYFDTLSDLGANPNNNTIMIPASPGGASSLMEEMVKGTLAAKADKR